MTTDEGSALATDQQKRTTGRSSRPTPMSRSARSRSEFKHSQRHSTEHGRHHSSAGGEKSEVHEKI